MNSKRDLDEDLIRQLANLLTENDLTEIEIEQDDRRVRVVRARASPEGTPAAQIVSHPAPQAAAPAPSAASAGAHPGAINSPMVGTAYRARDPDADPFVRIGDLVMEGQTVLIIEAMKVMNDIPAPRAGKVTRILVEDGQPVEYGEPLMIIE
jgi:acetyl-CoA carboxylase biotin carboxyl carrier protein